MLEIVFFIILGLYLILIGRFIVGFNNIPTYETTDVSKTTAFSIVIPFRNEAENLAHLLTSLNSINYPKSHFEVLLVNDNSNDDSLEVIQRILNTEYAIQSNIKIATNKRQSNSPKKDAITTAIAIAKYEWIITTDADCIFPRTWLESFNSYIKNNNCGLIAAPVTFNIKNTFFEKFQLLDFLSLQGATIGGFGIKKPFLCNGANLAYTKTLFKSINGFQGNNAIASGDDIFLLEKAISAYPEQISYLKSKDAIVSTNPETTLKQLISQRMRWASKTTAYNNLFGKLVGFIVLLMNALIISVFILSFMNILSWSYFLIIFGFKFFIDFLLIFKTARFFNQAQHVSAYFLSSILYPIFSVFIAVKSLFSGYNWKGRQFKILL